MMQNLVLLFKMDFLHNVRFVLFLVSGKEIGGFHFSLLGALLRLIFLIVSFEGLSG